MGEKFREAARQATIQAQAKSRGKATASAGSEQPRKPEVQLVAELGDRGLARAAAPAAVPLLGMAAAPLAAAAPAVAAASAATAALAVSVAAAAAVPLSVRAPAPAAAAASGGASSSSCGATASAPAAAAAACSSSAPSREAAAFATAERLLAAKAAVPASQVHLRASRAGIGAAARAAGQRAAKASRRLSLRGPEVPVDAKGRQGQKRPCAPSTEDSVPEPEPWRLLLRMALPPRTQEDNYEISDKGEDSDGEEPDRSRKYVPEWSKEYLSMLAKQGETDPDTIFGCRVPAVNLDVIFKDEDYRRIHKDRPKRRRGSSGNWGQDRLSRTEVSEYKKKMGQLRRISVDSGPVTVASQVERR